jgi:hypothetical protein
MVWSVYISRIVLSVYISRIVWSVYISRIVLSVYISRMVWSVYIIYYLLLGSSPACEYKVSTFRKHVSSPSS